MAIDLSLLLHSVIGGLKKNTAGRHGPKGLIRPIE